MDSTNNGNLFKSPDYYSDNLFKISLYPQIAVFHKKKNIVPYNLIF
jgi:hypothetical protein